VEKRYDFKMNTLTSVFTSKILVEREEHR
jgi:hypothetical protein